jgi:tight adherence protein B
LSGGLSLILILLSFLCLIGFGFGGLLVSQAEARRKKRAQRVHDVVSPYRQAPVVTMQAFRPAPKNERSLAEMAASIFGFDPANLAQYPVPWWIVLGIAFILARIGAGLIVSFFDSFGLISMPVLWVAMCRFFFGWAVGRRREALIQQFPDALAMIVRSVRVGMPVLGAITTVAREAQAPTAIEFTRLANDLAVGVPLDEATIHMGKRNDLSEYRFFATAIGLQAQTGGGLSETLENLADLIRKRLALRERGHALSSEARTSSLILAALPIVMGSGLWALNPNYMSVLFTTGMGHKILGAAIFSLMCGGMTMRTIIKKSLS